MSLRVRILTTVLGLLAFCCGTAPAAAARGASGGAGAPAANGAGAGAAAGAGGLSPNMIAPAPVSPVVTAPGYAGNKACQTCHPNIVVPFIRNPHFKSSASGKEAPENAGCEGCHGPGKAHIAGMGDKTKIVAFSRLEPAAVLDRCLRCHENLWGGRRFIPRSTR